MIIIMIEWTFKTLFFNFPNSRSSDLDFLFFDFFAPGFAAPEAFVREEPFFPETFDFFAIAFNYRATEILVNLAGKVPRSRR